MSFAPSVTPAQVVRSSLLSFLFLFALPVFSLWFGDYGVRSMDDAFLAEVIPAIERDASIPADQRPEVVAFYRMAVPSRVCASDSADIADLRAQLGSACTDYAQFRWMRVAALSAVGLGVLGVLVAIVGALAARRSRATQYRSFVASFQTLRGISALIVVLQGGLAVFLSFWVTAIFFESYSVKLVLVVGLLALLAVGLVVKAIFAKIPTKLPIDGTLVPKEKAAPLFARIESICRDLSTAPPDYLIAGIDDNFFVCEGDVECSDASLSGRVLYISLSLLRVLSRDEADAILAHEMAHFSGGDVEHSRKLAPALTRFGFFVGTLDANPLSMPVARFLVAFRSLFELAFGRERREREFAADATAARLTSPDDMARALVRVGAYASYGSRVETALFETDSVHESLDLVARIERGFGDYARSPKVAFDLVTTHIPHPFDSHPPLLERIAHVGSTVKEDQFSAILTERPTETYFDAIDEAAAIEGRLWRIYEERFRTNHELALAHRYVPSTPAEQALVEKHFPRVEFASRKADEQLVLDCFELGCSRWEKPLKLARIKKADINQPLMKKVLVITTEDDGLLSIGHKISLSDVVVGEQAFLDAFNRYWNRARASASYQAEHGKGGVQR